MHSATHKVTNKTVAIKIVKKKKLEQHEVYMQLMRNELEVLEKTDHPHITRVFELLEDESNFYVVMEFMSEGNLLDKVVAVDHFTED